ncbi:MAG: formate--tetrahydrofolate ligase [Planctomycetota bacterium]
MPTDLEIARKAKMLPIEEVAKKAGLDPKEIELHGHHKAKIPLDIVERAKAKPPGKLILVTAITPTPAGEGKTTTSVGLGDALCGIGKKTITCLREPSLGPCFGMKGGATGGGMAQVVPMEDINLHFNGDFHAVTAAHNLLAAMIDNHLHFGNALGIDIRNIPWRRCMDVNDRALREMVIGLGGAGNSVPRETGFDITAASEIMAVLCLASSVEDLRERLGRIIAAYTRDGKPVTAKDLKAQGAMTALMKDALQPNLVQTLENNPVFIHGGPFGNIAHGCNTVIATKLALGLADYVVTEAGFGSDLGMEKFMNIKCRSAKITPSAVVVVATVRALKYHGGSDLKELTKPNLAALEKGMDNLKKHIENSRKFGVPAVVAINSFTSDTPEEIKLIQDKCAHLGSSVVRCDHWARGGRGAQDLAKIVVETIAKTKTDFKLTYPDEMPLWQKAETVAREVYGADNILADKKLRDAFKVLQGTEYATFPVCMAKTQYSLSTDPGLRGRPKNFDVPLRGLRVAAGAGFVVVVTGEIMTMPGLPRAPAADNIDIDKKGHIVGLF